MAGGCLKVRTLQAGHTARLRLCTAQAQDHLVNTDRLLSDLIGDLSHGVPMVPGSRLERLWGDGAPCGQLWSSRSGFAGDARGPGCIQPREARSPSEAGPTTSCQRPVVGLALCKGIGMFLSGLTLSGRILVVMEG